MSDAPQSLLVYDENNLPLRLSYYAKISQTGEVLLQVFCDFWIVNRTGEALTVAEKKEDASTRRLCPAQNTSFCLPADFATGADHALKPVLFSTHVTDSAGSAGSAAVPRSSSRRASRSGAGSWASARWAPPARPR